MTTTAVAAVLRQKDGPFSIEDVTIETPRADEILVRVRAAGICHTDLFCRAQGLPVPLPLVLGHEGAGVVEQVGERVTKVAPGDHVVLTYGSCGRCPSCDQGQRAYCAEFFPRNFGCARSDGSSAIRGGGGASIHGNFFGQSSFASFAIATERNVVVVPRDLPLELLAPLGCGIQTGAGTVLNALRPRPGSSLAVFGVGSVGLSALLAAKVAGCTTRIAVDLHRSRLALASELGATHVIDATTTADVAAAIAAITGGGVEFTIDTTAVPRVLRSAVDALAPRGVCAAVGAAAFGTDVAIDAGALLAKGQTLRGVIEGESLPDSFIPALIALYRQQTFPFDRLITRYPFRDIDRAIADAERGAVIKPVLIFD